MHSLSLMDWSVQSTVLHICIIVVGFFLGFFFVVVVTSGKEVTFSMQFVCLCDSKHKTLCPSHRADPRISFDVH